MFGPSSCWAASLLILGFSVSHASAADRKPEPGELDTSAFRDSLAVFTDGAGHYMTMVTFETMTEGVEFGEHVYYGDGARLYAQKIGGASSDSKQRKIHRSFWEPRGGGSFAGQGVKYVLECHDRATAFAPLKDDARKAFLEKARFFPRLWKRRAYTLARDDEGTYYYVDRALQPRESFDFNLYRGTRGAMKPMPLVNIVSDSEGDIFAGKRGRLRLVLTNSSGRRQRAWEWIAGKARKPLVDVPVDRNAMLIYRDLGVYDGKRLGTPCDDL